MRVVTYYKLWLNTDMPEGRRRNLALNKPATQISQYLGFEAGKANDGIDGISVDTGGCSHTAGYAALVPETHPWWEVDLSQEYYISAVAISHPVYDLPQLAHNFSIEIYTDGETINDAVLCYYHPGLATTNSTELYWCKTTIKGRHVRITINGNRAEMLLLCEVKVIGSEYLTTTSFIKFDNADLESPDMTYSVQGYGQCAMKCYVLPMCHIFSVKSVSDYYLCNIFTNMYPKLVGNSTGRPGIVAFIM
ncbi:hypothetical protein LOTGIDRAFT_159958 [Lottia gigantea]|uniref:Fucolectin tachylectin-4 pentraxin-1 domain-containing protein n=1 Tax=Lottia gigantea TaxID=225164 RepID=V4AI07_LOTGI|nr:hypothetical protein LOTGIDRAFT_159958 [Lottia gigantea]ESO96542.1 hypothetical protein LOTGIDRAFT_159958 [Lottia gigantea]